MEVLNKNRIKYDNADEGLGVSAIIDALQNRLAYFGLNIRGYTPLSESRYRQLPQPAQEAIFGALNFALELVNSAPDDLSYEVLDRFMLTKACQRLNLKVPDDFLNLVRNGDIVEIYDLASQNQIYRNFEFLRLSSYDLLTVCVTPYPELFAREQGFDEKILARTQEITKQGLSTEPWNVPNHHLVERLESHQRRFFLNLGHIAPVYNVVTGERVAWASTIRVVNLGSSYQHAENVLPL